MNERITPHHESGEKLHVPDLAKENLERAKAAAESHDAHGKEHSVEHLTAKVHEQAVSGREYTVGEREAAPASHTFGTHKQLKADSYKRTLSHIRSKLTRSEKVLSKHVHSKRAEKLDNVVASTVARPWGMLVGGTCAFVGSLIVLVFASHYGFRYNFSVFLGLFIGGYIAGTLAEIIGKLLKRKQAN